MGSSWIMDWTHISCIGRQILYYWATREAPSNCFGKKPWSYPWISSIIFNVKRSCWLYHQNISTTSHIHSNTLDPIPASSSWSIPISSYLGSLLLLLSVHKEPKNLPIAFYLTQNKIWSPQLYLLASRTLQNWFTSFLVSPAILHLHFVPILPSLHCSLNKPMGSSPGLLKHPSHCLT